MTQRRATQAADAPRPTDPRLAGLMKSACSPESDEGAATTCLPTHATPDMPPVPSEALRASPAVILLVESDGRVVWGNRAFRPGSALPPGATVFGLLRWGREDALRAAIARVARGGPAEALDDGESGPSGAQAWFHLALSPDGRGRALLVATDSTDAKRAEERLRRGEALMVDTQGMVHMGTWEWDVAQPTAVWSAELYRIYGLSPDEYVPSYEKYLTMVNPEDRARVIAATDAVFREHKAYSHDERIFRKDGSMRWLHTWAQPILDENGKLVRLIGVCLDVTEQRLADQAVRAQTLTRGLARRLLLELVQRGQVRQQVVREVGRSLVEEQRSLAPDPAAYAEAFRGMGLGNLRFEKAEGNRFLFSATDLLERRATATLPTCFATLGYLEGIVSELRKGRALGTELRCQSTGHHECQFVIMAQA